MHMLTQQVSPVKRACAQLRAASGAVHHRLERAWLVLGEFSKHLPVERDAALPQRMHETAVGESERAECCVELHVPRAAGRTLFAPAIAVGIDTSFENGSFCCTNELLASPAKTLRSLEQTASFSCSCCSSFDAHGLGGMCAKIWHQAPQASPIRLRRSMVTVLADRCFPGFAGVEVILTRSTGKEFPFLGDGKTLARCLLRLHLWHGGRFLGERQEYIQAVALLCYG